ncbi:MAG: transposase [Desulfobacca sp.]|nr:transposase [Desulfobacca sp.]
MVIALAVTRDGLPVRSWVFPGQTADASTVTQIKADLRGWNLGRALLVADAGMNSPQNRQELAKGCGTYLLATRLGSQAEVKEEVLTRPGRFKVIAENLQAKEVMVGDGERRRRDIVCYNPLEAKRQQLHREQVLRELEAELAKHPDLKATARGAIDLLASGRYRRYVKIEAATNRLAINRQAAREAARTDGKWVLITNDDTITLEDAASGYKGLLVIERCFRTLKSTQIKLTPMYHWLDQRGHLNRNLRFRPFGSNPNRKFLDVRFLISLALGKLIEELHGEVRKMAISKEKTVKADDHFFTAVLTSDIEDGGYTVQCQEIPAATFQGETEQEALDNIIEVLEEHFEYEKRRA